MKKILSFSLLVGLGALLTSCTSPADSMNATAATNKSKNHDNAVKVPSKHSEHYALPASTTSHPLLRQWRRPAGQNVEFALQTGMRQYRRGGETISLLRVAELGSAEYYADIEKLIQDAELVVVLGPFQGVYTILPKFASILGTKSALCLSLFSEPKDEKPRGARRRILDGLAESGQDVPHVTRTVNEHTMVFVPQINPVGRGLVYKRWGGFSSWLWLTWQSMRFGTPSASELEELQIARWCVSNGITSAFDINRQDFGKDKRIVNAIEQQNAAAIGAVSGSSQRKNTLIIIGTNLTFGSKSQVDSLDDMLKRQLQAKPSGIVWNDALVVRLEKETESVFRELTEEFIPIYIN
jgi:hypothetical protein